MNKRHLVPLLTLVLCLFLLHGLAEGRNIQIQTAEKPPFAVTFEPAQKVYHAGERIQFVFKSEKSCYLYLFSIDEKNNTGVMILPNDLHKYNKFRANTKYTVPDKPVEFYAKEPGVENVIMVASQKKLNFNPGSYVRLKDSYQAKADVILKDLKALSIRPQEEKADTVMLEAQVIVVGPGASKPEAGSSGASARARTAGNETAAMAFIAADRKDYKVGDELKMTYGADQPGQVSVYLVEPSGKKTLLKKQDVDGEHFYKIKAEVTRPAGEHTLLAVYGKEPAKGEAGADAKKGLSVIDDAKDAISASVTFKVKE